MFVKFCRCSLKNILIPAAINIFALNIACVSKWKKVRWGIPIPSVVTIRPSCLMVERAMVSLSSFLVIAQAAGTVIVIEPEISKIVLK